MRHPPPGSKGLARLSTPTFPRVGCRFRASAKASLLWIEMGAGEKAGKFGLVLERAGSCEGMNLLFRDPPGVDVAISEERVMVSSHIMRRDARSSIFGILWLSCRIDALGIYLPLD
jgi:hypothetical protein